MSKAIEIVEATVLITVIFMIPVCLALGVKPHIHWLRGHSHNFVDRVTGRDVFKAECRCGKKFLTDSLFPIDFGKVEIDGRNTKV